MACVAGLAGITHAAADDYPSKTIRMVTGGDPGGGNDTITRIIMPGIANALGQLVIIDNRQSAVIGDIIARSPPDGYTFCITGGTFLIGPLMVSKPPYDPEKDFITVTVVSTEPAVLVVHSSVVANSVKELIALAKAKPGALNYATTGSGGIAHLSGALFAYMAGVNIVRVPYKGGGAAVIGLISGETQMAFSSTSSVSPHIKSGKLRALAVSSSKPSALVPGLPTVAAAGVPGYESLGITGVWAPARTPESIVNRMNRETVRVLNQPEIRDKLLNLGQEMVADTPQHAAQWIKADLAKWRKLIKDAGIKAD
jgi:tripartite-type tricarboxylate transporter receptor subunit TctC